MVQSYHWPFTDKYQNPVDEHVFLALVIESVMFQVLPEVCHLHRVDLSLDNHRFDLLHQTFRRRLLLILFHNDLLSLLSFLLAIFLTVLFTLFGFLFLHKLFFIIVLDHNPLFLLFLNSLFGRIGLFANSGLFLYLSYFVHIFVFLLLYLSLLQIHSGRVLFLLLGEVLVVVLHCFKQQFDDIAEVLKSLLIW